MVVEEPMQAHQSKTIALVARMMERDGDVSERSALPNESPIAAARWAKVKNVNKARSHLSMPTKDDFLDRMNEARRHSSFIARSSKSVSRAPTWSPPSTVQLVHEPWMPPGAATGPCS